MDADVKQIGDPAPEVVSIHRWLLTLPVTEAVGDDVWCACLFCGLPRQGTNPLTNKMVGTRVEFLVRLRDTFGSTVQKGLHKDCWQKNVTDVFDYIGALDAANKLIGEAADDATKLADERDQLGDMCAAYEEKFKLQRDVVDAAVEYEAMFSDPPGGVKVFADLEQLCRRYDKLRDSVRAMLLAAKERGDGTT